MQKILKLTVILLLICAVVAGVLGVIYNVTKGPIEEQQAAKTAAAYAAVLEASGYTDVDLATVKAAHPTIDRISTSDDGNGYVVTSTYGGAQGKITMIVGVDSDLICTGISITKHSETSGLGANAASAGEVGINFRSQFVGKDGSVTLNDIDALTGATITSRAVTDAVAECIAAVADLG